MKIARHLLTASSLLLASALASASDPVTDAAKLATVEKHGTRDEARAQRKSELAEGRHAGEFGSNEYKRNKNELVTMSGTKDARQAQRQAQREEVRRQAVAGEIPSTGEEWISNRNDPQAVAGTREERRAERREKRAEVRDATKRGEFPLTTEAAVGLSR